jgi:hypothetical protein
MSDVFCNACGRYHASLTVCPNENIMDTKHTPPLCKNCVAVTSLEAEIAHLKAREEEMRKPLNEIVTLCQEMDYSTMCPAADLIRHIGNVGRIEQLARALLAREHAEDRGPVIDAVCRKCDWYDNYDSESCEHHDRSCIAHSLFSAPKPAEERGPEVGQ